MGKEKLKGRNNSVWPVFSLWNFLGAFFRRRNHKSSFGLTLLELIVVIAILAILVAIGIAFLNPFAQIKKTQDVTKENDIKELSKALDIYYHDYGCYPTALDVLVGTYIKQLPQPPDLSQTREDYAYILDNTAACPQWYALFSKLSYKRVSTVTCSLEKLTSCTPEDYDELEYNSCDISGSITSAECSVISGSSIVDNFIGGGPPPPPPPCSKNYACTGDPVHCSVVAPGTGQYCTTNCDGACP